MSWAILAGVMDAVAFVTGVTKTHQKKTALGVSVAGAVAAYVGSSKLSPLGDALQSEAQSFLLRQATRDMSTSGVVERSEATTPRAVEMFLPAFAARLETMYDLDGILRALKSLRGDLRVTVLQKFHQKSATCCVTATLSLAFFTAAIRVVVVFFDKIRTQLEAAGYNVDDMKSLVLQKLTAQLLDHGMPALSTRVTAAVSHALSLSSLKLTDVASPAYVEQFFRSVVKFVMDMSYDAPALTKPGVSSDVNGSICVESSEKDAAYTGEGCSEVKDIDESKDARNGRISVSVVGDEHGCVSSPSSQFGSMVSPTLYYTPSTVVGLLTYKQPNAITTVTVTAEEAVDGKSVIADRILDCVWDLVELPSFQPVFEELASGCVTLLINDVTRLNFSESSTGSPTRNGAARITALDDESPPRSPSAVNKNVALVNIVLGFRTQAKKLLVPDHRLHSKGIDVVTLAAQWVPLTGYCNDVLRYAYLPPNLFYL